MVGLAGKNSVLCDCTMKETDHWVSLRNRRKHLKNYPSRLQLRENLSPSPPLISMDDPVTQAEPQEDNSGDHMEDVSHDYFNTDEELFDPLPDIGDDAQRAHDNGFKEGVVIHSAREEVDSADGGSLPDSASEEEIVDDDVDESNLASEDEVDNVDDLSNSVSGGEEIDDGGGDDPSDDGMESSGEQIYDDIAEWEVDRLKALSSVSYLSKLTD